MGITADCRFEVREEHLVSIQLGSPASGDIAESGWGQNGSGLVSIQLGSPASGDTNSHSETNAKFSDVSIQLGSPASGDWVVMTFSNRVSGNSFHSIRIPSEWGYLESPSTRRRPLFPFN